MHTFKIKILIQFLVSTTCFRTSCVHHQEDDLYMQFCMVCFSYIYVSSLAGGKICPTSYAAYINIRKTYHTIQHVQMVFLMTNTCCSIYAEEAKNWNKTLFWKCAFVGLLYIIVSRCTVHKTQIKYTRYWVE